MLSDLALLDTNILLRSLYADSPHYSAARALINQAKSSDAAFCVVPQVLAEFYAVVTNPSQVPDVKTSAEALATIRIFLKRPGITLLPAPVDIFERWSALLEKQPVTGRKFFDVQLVAAMLGNGVKKIYTFNVNDFSPFAELEVLEPSEPLPEDDFME